MPAVEYSKSFITSVVVGKDVVPRIGLHQMEALRADLINAIKRSVDPKVRERKAGINLNVLNSSTTKDALGRITSLLTLFYSPLFSFLSTHPVVVCIIVQWKTIACSVFCCGCGPEPTSVSEMSSKDANINAYEEVRAPSAAMWTLYCRLSCHSGALSVHPLTLSTGQLTRNLFSSNELPPGTRPPTPMTAP